MPSRFLVGSSSSILLVEQVGLKSMTLRGRQVNDPSFRLHRLDSGALNDHIDKKLDCPTIFYQAALMRVLIRAYNLSICHPQLDIIAYVDDFVTAIRRNRYYPDVSPAHSFVFEDFLILPVGMVIGARDSPAWFCQISEIRAFASEHFSSLNLHIPDQTLIDLVTFDTDDGIDFSFTQCCRDQFNQG